MEGGDVSLQIGQEQYYYIKNQSGATIENGKVVRAAGTLGTSGRILGEYMIADGTIPPKFTLGIATEDILNGEDGYVTEFGLVRGVDTTGSLYGETWNDGDVLWVSPTFEGGLTNVEPLSPNLHIEMAIVINAAANGSLFVRPHRYPYSYDLQDMGWSAGTETNLDIIQWNDSLGYFELTNTPTLNSLSAATITANTLTINNNGPNVSITNPNSGEGLILEGVGGAGNTSSTLRIVSNDNAWADNVTTSYFQIDTANGVGPDYVTFMGGTFGTDTPFKRLQFNSSGTTFTDCPFGDTPVPTSIVDVVVKNPTTNILNLIGATGQTGDYLNITTNGGINGDVLKVSSNKDSDFGGRILSGGTDIATLWGGGSFTSFDISDGNNTQTIDDGDTLLFSSNSGLTTTVSATDTVTFDYELSGMTAESSPTTGDKLLLWDASSGLHKNIDWNQLPGAAGGEANTASNVGVGYGIFKQKTGVDLEFRSLSAGTNVTITTGDTIVISSTGGGSSRIESSITTIGNTPTELEKIDTLTDNATNIVEVYVKAYSTAGLQWGVWKRTLTVTKTLGTVTIQEVNADVDKTSTGLKANDLTFTVNGGDIDVDVSGIAATTIDWKSAYEIIL